MKNPFHHCEEYGYVFIDLDLPPISIAMAKSMTCTVCGQVVQADPRAPGIFPKFCEECGSLLQPSEEPPVTVLPAHNAVITIHCDLSARREIGQKLISFPEIMRVWLLSGNGGILAFAKVKEMEALQPLVDRRIANLAGVRSVEMCLVLKELKK